MDEATLKEYEKIFLKMKDKSELMVDLAYTADQTTTARPGKADT